jgi:hypothetical protein
MTVKNMLLKFFLWYCGFVFGAGIIARVMHLKGFNAAQILLFVFIWGGCSEFGKKNGRYFSDNEKRTVIVGFFTISLFVQFAGLAPLIQTFMHRHLSITPLLIGSVVDLLINTAIIFGTVKFAQKQLIKKGVIQAE